MPKLALICAMSLNRVIGRNNQLPWHLPADLQFLNAPRWVNPSLWAAKPMNLLAALYLAAPILLLPANSIWLMRAHLATSLPMAIEKSVMQQRLRINVNFVIGGADLYEQALPLAEALYLTQVQTHIDGDAYFPAWDKAPGNWEQRTPCSG